MAIEQMRIRMGEMAAEIDRLQSENEQCGKALNGEIILCDSLRAQNARLQSIIDEANAQPAVGIADFQYQPDGTAIVEVSLSKQGNINPGDEIFTRPIPAQQSTDYAALRKWYVNLTNSDSVQDGINVNGRHCTEAMLSSWNVFWSSNRQQWRCLMAFESLSTPASHLDTQEH